MTSLTPSFRRALAITIACAALGLSATACSALPDSNHAASSASSAGSGDDGTASNTGICADALGPGFADESGSDDGDDSDMTAALATWDKMAADAPSDIKSDVVAVDETLHKVSKGDGGAADAAFADHMTKVGTWVADNCNL